MKNLSILCIAFLSCMCAANAQTTIYFQNFNSGSAPEWSLNTTDLSGDNSLTDNYWIINNVYVGGTMFYSTTIPNTPDEVTGMAGVSGTVRETNYLHILSEAAATYSTYSYYGGSSGGIFNSNFNADGTRPYFAAMNTPIVTTGYCNVAFSFWWLCQGDVTAYGKVYYRTSASGAWTAIPGGPATYYGSSTWTLQTVTNVAFDNQPFLEFGFQFTQSFSGSDPAFSVDDIKVVGTRAPVASFTTSNYSICADSTVTFTSTSTGTVDSVTWSVTGMTVAGAHSPTVTITFPTSGVDTIHLNAYNCMVNTRDTFITVKPMPHPVITHATGKHLTAPAAYASYQWTNGVTPIAGATNNSYSYVVGGTYGLLVDSSDGCMGFAQITVSTVGVTNINGADNKYWITQSAGAEMTINAGQPLDEAVLVNIFDATGRQMTNDYWGKSAETKTINVASYPPGMYIIKLSNERTSTSLQWIKQ